MAESIIDLSEGQKNTVDDWDGLSSSVINWMTDNAGSIRPRPGIVTDSRLRTGDTSGVGVIGAYVWTSIVDSQPYLVYVLSDRTIRARSLSTGVDYSLSTASATTKLDGAAGNVSFSEDSQRLVMAGGGQIQMWKGNNGTPTSRIAAFVIGTNQPPRKATHIVNVASYLVSHDIATPDTANHIIWSNLGDGNHETWDPANFNTADADPDSTIAVGSILRDVFAIGTKSVQVFGFTADPNLPFASTASLRIGCISPYSLVSLDNALTWLDDQRRFIISDGRSYEWISQDIYRSIQDMETVTDCFGFRLRIGYWDLVNWVFPTEKKAFVYNASRKDWREWRGWNGVDDYDGIRISSYASYPEGNLHVVGDPKNTNLWALSTSATSDSAPGLPIVCEKITSPVDHGSAGQKRSNRIRFFCKRGQSPITLSENAFLDVAISNDGKAFSSPSRVDLGFAGDYTNHRDYFPGGIFRRKQLRIRYSADVDVSVTGAMEMWSPHGVETG
jgi:hypothetical protein